MKSFNQPNRRTSPSESLNQMMVLKTLSMLALTSLSVAATYDIPKTDIDHRLMQNSIYYGLVVTASTENSTSLCNKHLVEIADGIFNKTKWAMKLIDASGMPSGGLRWGGIYWLGSKSQCEATRVLHKFSTNPSLGHINVQTIKDIPPFPTGYFAAYFQHDSDIQIVTNVQNEFRMVLGLCLPASCEGPELTGLLQKYFDSEILVHQSLYNTSYKMEFVRKLFDGNSWLSDYKIIAFLSMIAVVIMMCIIGTVYDIKCYQPMIKTDKSLNISNGITENTTNSDNTDTKLHKQINIGLGCKIIRCFSVYSNNKLICNTNISSNSQEIIHGIRFFSTIIVILSHSVLVIYPGYDNGSLAAIKPTILGVFSLSLINFTVDTFFCISGYLLACLFFQTEYGPSKKKSYNISERANLFGFSILKRILRITPSYLISFAMTIIVLYWKVAEYPIINKGQNHCLKYWWRNVLYINSFFPHKEMCLAYTWYLSDDMQFFIVVIFCLILSTMYFKTAVLLITSMFLGSIGYIVYTVYEHEFYFTPGKLNESVSDMYHHPFVRIGPYLVGVCAAYLVYYFKKRLTINKFVKWLIRIIITAMIIFSLFGLTFANQILWYNALYLALSRIFWAIGIAWLIVAYETGNGGMAGKFLSMKMWFPLSRLTYVSYLLNVAVIYGFISNSDAPYHMAMHKVLYRGSGFVVLTLLASYMFTLIFESPSIALNKLLFDSLSGSKKSNNNVQNLQKKDVYTLDVTVQEHNAN